MLRSGGQPERPVVVVFSAGAVATEREVLAGIEEEGVPYTVQRGGESVESMAATELAQRAAQHSPLQVGVGVGVLGDVCVHHDKLNAPLAALCAEGVVTQDVARVLGHNAARIVIGLPLKFVAGQ